MIEERDLGAFAVSLLEQQRRRREKEERTKDLERDH